MSAEQPKSVDKFLIVDDSSTNRLLLRAILQSAGYEVDECVDGRECLDYCQKYIPRMILLDVMMPEVNGIEVCSVLRESYNKDALPIILVTTKSEADDIALGLAAGANDYVTKPIDRKVLMARIESQLNHTESHHLIAEQKKAIEQALKIQNAMGDVLPDAIAITNNDGIVLYVNDLLTSICDDRNPQRVEDLFEWAFEGRLQSMFAPLREVLEQQVDQEIDEEFEVFAHGHWNYRLVSRPFSIDGAQTLRVWLFRDLTQMRELERKLNQQLKLDTVSTFAMGVAHNFNNMMGGILGAAQLLRRRVNKDASCEKLLDVIEKSIASGSRLTEKMSSLVRRELESHAEDRESVMRVLEIVADAASSVSDKAVEIQVAGDQDVFVNLSLKNSIDIFQNLILNAVDAIDQVGQIKVDVQVDQSTQLVNILVEDNGRGMSQEELARIFEPFYSTKNLDQRNKVSMEGNGLGMWNVYNLVKACGGEIDIQSAPGQGTQVMIELPVYESSQTVGQES